MSNWLLSFGAVFGGIAALFFMCDGNNPLAYLRPYRRWRGGRWANCSSMVPWVGRMWMRVTDECVERCDEDYTSVGACAQQSVRPDVTTDDTTPAAQPAGRTGEHE